MNNGTAKLLMILAVLAAVVLAVALIQEKNEKGQLVQKKKELENQLAKLTEPTPHVVGFMVPVKEV